MEGEKKYSSNAHKDVKRKLSFIHKKIGDVQRQRKFAYKNSAKVKKVVHYQINQIVKCLRARERSLWADVDEAYLSLDEHISDELSRLQSVHARCEALFDHLDDNRANVDGLEKIYSILSEVKFGEKPDVKALEFVSEFEAMKSMASCFGHLDGDYIKKDEFVCIDKRDTNSSDLEDGLDKAVPIISEKFEDSPNTFSPKSVESEDSFEIVDLLENMCCDDFEKDTVMVEQENIGICNKSTGCSNYSSQNECKFLKASTTLENSVQAFKDYDFNPEEEWKQIIEMRNRIENFRGMTSKLSDENKNCEKQNTTDIHFNADKCSSKSCKKNACLYFKDADNWLLDKSSRKEMLDKSHKQNECLLLKETGNWLHNKSLVKDSLKERNFGKNMGIYHASSPAEIVRNAFSSYLRKGNIENWLLCK